MTLSQYFRDRLRDILAKRREPKPMNNIPPDNDAPKEMGKARHEDVVVGTAHVVKNAAGEPV